MLFLEKSLVDLYKSTILFAPNTAYRQNATDTIKITHLDWLPFKGVKTLFVKGLAQNEGKEYNPIIVFKKVNYDVVENVVSITATDKMRYVFEKLSLQETDVLIRCNCKDFKYRFLEYLDPKTRYGSKPKPYWKKTDRPYLNPLKIEACCKHLLKLMKVLDESGLFLSQ
jgi:hypothetical protein